MSTQKRPGESFLIATANGVVAAPRYRDTGLFTVDPVLDNLKGFLETRGPYETRSPAAEPWVEQLDDAMRKVPSTSSRLRLMNAGTLAQFARQSYCLTDPAYPDLRAARQRRVVLDASQFLDDNGQLAEPAIGPLAELCAEAGQGPHATHAKALVEKLRSHAEALDVADPTVLINLGDEITAEHWSRPGAALDDLALAVALLRFYTENRTDPPADVVEQRGTPPAPRFSRLQRQCHAFATQGHLNAFRALIASGTRQDRHDLALDDLELEFKDKKDPLRQIALRLGLPPGGGSVPLQRGLPFKLTENPLKLM